MPSHEFAQTYMYIVVFKGIKIPKLAHYLQTQQKKAFETINYERITSWQIEGKNLQYTHAMIVKFMIPRPFHDGA